MKRVEFAIKKLQDELQGKYVLEAACGCAEFSIGACELVDYVECIDIDEKRLLPEFARLKNVTFCKMDVAEMTYADESFDTVIMYNAVGHLDYVLERAVDECIRVLKKRGCLAVVSSSKMDKYVVAEKLIPLLQFRKMNYILTEEKVFTIVRIVK